MSYIEKYDTPDPIQEVHAMNAMVTIPGQFKSFGHDYRGDMARFIHAAYQFEDISEDQIQAVDDKLRELEIERGARIAAAKESAEEAAAKEDVEGALEGERTKGPKKCTAAHSTHSSSGRRRRPR